VKALKKEYPNAKIFISGHSLGGAVVNLAALDIVNLVAPVDFYISLE